MIKTTRLNSTIENSPILVIIPGGPGLSSLTLRSLDCLNERFNLIYIDFPGCNNTDLNDNPYTKDQTFEELSNGVVKVVNELKEKNKLVFVLGHSFGGFFAADIALKTSVDGIICIATPFSNKSLHNANDNYNKAITNSASEALLLAEAEWGTKKDDRALAKWLSEYGKMYFVRPEGKKLIECDKASAKFFLNNRADVIHGERLLEKIGELKIKKIVIAGSEDGLLDVETLRIDAEKGKFEFFEVEKASHFVMVDNIEKVREIIIKSLDK